MVHIRQCFQWLVPILLLYSTSAPLHASSNNWPALPTDVWAIKASDYTDATGAVVLQDRIHFHRRSMERFRRLLVLADVGRSLAEFQLIGAKVKKLEGRTITSDGNEQAFVQNSDIVKVILLSGKREDLEAVKVIPPGVTAHCVVDVRWVEPIDDSESPVPEGYGYNLLMSMSSAAPVRLAEVVFDDAVADGDWFKKVSALPGQNQKMTSGVGFTTYSFIDIPARPIVPLASKADLQGPFLNWFLRPKLRPWLTYLGFPLNQSVLVSDSAAKTIYYKDLMECMDRRTWFYQDLKAMGVGIQGSVQDRSTALIRLLRSKIKTIPELPSPPARKQYEASLESVLKRGWGTWGQICKAGFHLLRANGLDASMVMAIDREESRMVDPDNFWQFNYMLLSVPDEKGETLYLNPGSTFHPLGLPPWIQGSHAMVIRAGKERLDWTARIVTLPASSPETNHQNWKVAISPDTDADTYKATFQANGHAASLVRYGLSEEHAATFGKALEPLLQRNGFLLRKAEETKGEDSWKGLSYAFQGVHEHEGGRRRLILPFPFIGEPFTIPTAWPNSRTLDIQLPMNTLIEAEARMAWHGTVPEDQDLAPISGTNEFGKVSWTAQVIEGESGKELVVKLVVKIDRISSGPSQYTQLMALAGWIQEALHRGIPVPRV